MSTGTRQISAAVCRGFGEPLTIESVELANPGKGEVSVSIGACAICHSDIMYMDGHWGGELPAVFGHEAAGVIDAVGSEVMGLAVGDHVVVTLIRSCGACRNCEMQNEVLCDAVFELDRRSPLATQDGKTIQQGLRTGAFAEKVTVDASQVCRVPEELPFDIASLLACGVITGFGAVTNTAAVPPGSSVVVIGCGGVGLNSIQAAAASNASSVIAIDVVDEKLRHARGFGATVCVNARADDTAKAVSEATAGRGADYVFVSVGDGKVLSDSMPLLASGGTMVVVGMPPTGVVAEYDPGDFAARSQRILGSKMGSSRVRVDIPRLLQHYREGRLKLDELISGRYPIERINDAIDALKSGAALRNVIVF